MWKFVSRYRKGIAAVLASILIGVSTAQHLSWGIVGGIVLNALIVVLVPNAQKVEPKHVATNDPGITGIRYP